MFFKFSYSPFVVTTTFKDDYSLSITASQASGDYFINENVELNRIKKQTVIAALSRKCENQIKCEFNIVDVEPKKLILAIIVSYDFLPTFTEFISLEQLDRTKCSKVEFAELRSDVDDLEKLVDALGTNGAPLLEQTFTVDKKGDLYKAELGHGSYLVEVNGFFMCTSQPNTNSHQLQFIFAVGKREESVRVTAYTLSSSYGYPISFRKEVSDPHDFSLTLSVAHREGFSFNLKSAIISVSPSLQLS